MDCENVVAVFEPGEHAIDAKNAEMEKSFQGKTSSKEPYYRGWSCFVKLKQALQVFLEVGINRGYFSSRENNGCKTREKNRNSIEAFYTD